MKWLWYFRESHEVLVDLDHASRGKALARIQALRLSHGGPYDVLTRDIQPSCSPGHYHIRVALLGHIPDTLAVSFALRLGSDPDQAGHNLYRIANGIDRPILLIATRPLGRDPDAVCECEHKHDTTERMRACPIGSIYRPHNLRDWYGDTRGWA